MSRYRGQLRFCQKVGLSEVQIGQLIAFVLGEPGVRTPLPVILLQVWITPLRFVVLRWYRRRFSINSFRGNIMT